MFFPPKVIDICGDQSHHSNLLPFNVRFLSASRSAFSEITSLVKQKAATDQELLSEIHALGRQLSMKTAELEAVLKGDDVGKAAGFLKI